MSGPLASNPPDEPRLRLVPEPEASFDAVPPGNAVQVEEPVDETVTTAVTSPKPADSRAGLVVLGIVVVGLFLLIKHKPVDVFHAVDLDDDDDDDDDEDVVDVPEPEPEDVADVVEPEGVADVVGTVPVGKG